MTKIKRPKVTAEIHDFIVQNYKGRLTSNLTELINSKFGTNYDVNYIKSYKSRFSLWSGVNTQWGHGQVNCYLPVKGYIHPNSRATQFKKGFKPINTVQVGSEVLRRDGLIWVKVNDLPGRHDLVGRWKQRARIVWETSNGPLNKDEIVLHLDGNSTNDKLENLAVVTKGQLATINRFNLISEDPKITKVGIKIAEISSILYKNRRNK